MKQVRLVMGTQNPSKYEEMVGYFRPFPEIVPVAPQSLGLGKPDVEESADSVRGNAILKARAWCLASGHAAFAEDSGLVFTDLDENDPDQPGQFVRRFHGRELTDDELLERFIRLVRAHGGTLRACWQNCWCMLSDPQHGEVYENRSRIFLMKDVGSPVRTPGWPLDSISYLPELGCFLSEADHEALLSLNASSEEDRGLHAWLASAAGRLAEGSLPSFSG